MKRLLVAVILMLPIAAVGQCVAPADCTVGEMKPLLKPSKAVKIATLKPREVTEVLTLANKQRITVKQGGCAHYGVQVVFTIGASEDPLVAALTVLKKVRAATSKPEVFDQMLTILERHGKTAKPGEALQDKEFEMTTVYLETKQVKDKQEVTVTFSFAL